MYSHIQSSVRDGEAAPLGPGWRGGGARCGLERRRRRSEQQERRQRSEQERLEGRRGRSWMRVGGGDGEAGKEPEKLEGRRFGAGGGGDSQRRRRRSVRARRRASGEDRGRRENPQGVIEMSGWIDGTHGA
ncbi:hypothetical protein GUJ93_ZPchr0008g14034 [Zizania palustris]|uniref:Uncharacterized protein n=1 Tax=Zizania palustris TaxID=103762 RepID=A0A8J5RWC4_ZIZPA|nr:hypothetical protein GUJ93_ZPchr0008g14034 [Zizania palustris]